MPRNEMETRVRMDSQEYKNRPSLDRYSIEVQVASLFPDHTVSWVRIVSGVDKYVSESMLTAKEEDIASEKPTAKARPRQKPTVTMTSVSIPVTERVWIEVETQRSHDHECKKVPKSHSLFATT